jgi:putative transposase
MPQKKQPIEFGNYYHIYNRGNNSGDLFFEPENYYHFLRLYEKYVDPIAETYAWCLLKNHFHLLVRIKDKEEIAMITNNKENDENSRVLNPSKQFGHLFNAYTQAINKRYNRTGNLFEGAFERKLVTSECYFQKLIFYIHNNPVHHGFVENMIEYPWSSYLTVTSEKPTKLNREEVIKIYGDILNFKYFHQQKQNFSEIQELIIE